MRTASIVLALAAATLAGTAGAQTIWRCGNTFSQAPCDAGVSVAAAVPRQPSAQDAARAQAAARTDAQRAEALRKARLAQEAQAPKAVIMAAPQPAAEKAPKKESPVKLARGEKVQHFTAVSQAPAAKRKK